MKKYIVFVFILFIAYSISAQIHLKKGTISFLN